MQQGIRTASGLGRLDRVGDLGPHLDPAMAAESLDEAEQLQTCGNDARSREGLGVWSVFALETDHLANSEK